MSFLDATGLGTFWGKLKNYFVSKNNFYTDIPDGLCHNSIYREKDITADYLSGKVSTNIANGTFHDIFPGDRITLNNRTYVVGGLNYYYDKGSSGSTALQTNHILMFPLSNVLSGKMNDTDTTNGGYKGSAMYTALASTASGSAYAIISGDFGASHMLKIPVLLSDTVVAVQGAMFYNENYPGRTNNWSWSQENLVLMTEPQVFGTVVNSSSAYDIGEGAEQIPVFFLNHRLISDRNNYWWLRAVADGRRFCYSSNHGNCDTMLSGSGLNIRPLFLIK